jgi:hypothetical protein
LILIVPRERLYRFAARLRLPTTAGVTLVVAREIDIHAPARDLAWRRLHDTAMAMGALEVLSARIMLELL